MSHDEVIHTTAHDAMLLKNITQGRNYHVTANPLLEYFSFFTSFVREVKRKMRSKHGKRITIVKNHHPTHLCLLQGKPQKSFTIFGKFIENDFIIMRIIFRDSNWVAG